jgi:DNA polymerase-1
VAENAESARLSKRLAQLCYDAPVPLDLAQLRFASPRPEKLGPFLRRIEAFGLLRELGLSGEAASSPATPPAPAAPPAPTPPPAAAPAVTVESLIDRSRYRTLLHLEELAAELEAAGRAGELSVDLETTSLEPTRADIVGIAMAVAGRAPVYLPVAHRYLGAPRQLERALVLERLRDPLEDPKLRKIGQNIKYDRIVFRRAGVHLAGIADDSMLAAWVLDPSRPSYSMDTLAREYLGHETIRYGDVTGKGKHQVGFDEVPVDQATAYSAEDADVALRLVRTLVPKIEAAGLTRVYRELELPLVEVLAQMEETGFAIDAPYLGRLGTELAARLATIEQQAHAMIGEPINLASPKQLATLFFDKLGYPAVKKTKTGYSTDQEVLEILAKTYDLPRVILEHRLLAKLKSTYVDALPKMQNPETGRVHTSFNQTGTATGRLSSSDPNLQNIPIRTDDGRRIREAFITTPGWEILSADYSQVELRLMAHLSGDEHFVEAFRRGEDVHERTAREVLTGGAPPSVEQRRQAKAINFGILYGLSDFGLSRQLGISKSEASAFITAYFARYPGVRTYLDRTIEEGREQGFVVTIAGRRRFLPDLKSRNRTAQQAAERVAMNTPIQGSAADLIKLAMVRVARALGERRLHARLLLQVHDELVLEAPREEREEVLTLLKKEMAGVMQLSVPLTVDVGQGDNWATAH